MTANLALWATADLMWTVHYNHLADPPSPNLADVFYLATYPCAYVGLVLLMRARLRPVRASLWLDGAVSGLTLAALATALLFAPLLSATEGDPTTVAVALAYPSATCCCCARSGSPSPSPAGAPGGPGA